MSALRANPIDRLLLACLCAVLASACLTLPPKSDFQCAGHVVNGVCSTASDAGTDAGALPDDIGEDAATDDDTAVEADIDDDAPPPPPEGLWTQIALPKGVNTDLHGIWSEGTTRVLAAGTGGTVIGYDGLSWQVLTSGKFASLNGIAATPGAAQAFAVGMGGTVIQAAGQNGKPGASWGLPGGCGSAADCEDNDPCTTDACEAGVCQHGPSGAPGCCGGAAFADSFDKGLGKWQVSDLHASAGGGGIVWTAAAMTGKDGGARVTSPPKAAYFGRTDVPCADGQNGFCGSFDNGKVVGAEMKTLPFVVPKSAKAELNFQLFADVGASFDALTVTIAPQNGKPAEVVWKREDKLPSGSTGGKFVQQKLDLTKFGGQTVVLRFAFDSQTTSDNGGEGVFIDDVVLTTTCAPASTAGKGLTPQTFFGVWASSEKEAWAVGAGGAMARWDGKSWALAGGGTTKGNLWGIGGGKDGPVMAVGDGGFAGSLSPSGLAKNGTDSPTTLRSVAVTNATDAIAVGPAGLWLTWDGTSWSKQAAFTPQNLNAIAAYGNGSYVAVTAQGQIWKRTGKTWTQVGGVPFPLLAVTTAGVGKAWAVGQMGTIASEAGGQWSIQIGAVGNGNLAGVGASSDKDVWAVGDNGFAAHFDGTAWSPAPTGDSHHLRSVWAAAPDDVWAVGLLGTVLHFNGDAWALVDSPVQSDLQGVWGKSPAEIYAIGSGGKVMLWDGNLWTDLTGTKVTVSLRAVWGLAADDVWAVGEKGTIVHYDGAKWQATPIEPFEIPDAPKPYLVTSTLLAVWGSAKDDVWAAGLPDAENHGVLVHWDGETWQYSPVFRDETRPVRAIWGWAKDRILLAGTQGMLWQFNGQDGLVALQPPTTATIFGMTGFGKDVLLAGDDSTLLRYTPVAQPVAKEEEP